MLSWNEINALFRDPNRFKLQNHVAFAVYTYPRHDIGIIKKNRLAGFKHYLQPISTML